MTQVMMMMLTYSASPMTSQVNDTFTEEDDINFSPVRTWHPYQIKNDQADILLLSRKEVVRFQQDPISEALFLIGTGR